MRAIISLFWFTLRSKESFEDIFISRISFWLAVSYPFLDTLDPDTEPALEPGLDPTLEPLIIFACYFSENYIWHLPIFISGCVLTVKNTLFLVF